MSRWPRLFIPLCIGLLTFYFSRPGTANDKQYVFINMTADHQFDDSIRLTIFANQKRANVQNAVVIADQIPAGESLESWADRLFRQLKLGKLTGGKAILYLFVPKERRLKIEIGYMLEGVLPDATVKALEEAAKSFTYANRYHDFWADLINTLNVIVQTQAESDQLGYDIKEWRYLSGGGGVTNATYDVSAEQLRREFRELPKGETRFQSTKDAKQTLELYLESLNEGIGDFTLPLLSTGSQIYRRRAPMNRALLKRMAKMYQDARPYTFAEERGQALAWFKENNPVLPIFLFQNSDGLWRVHEPYSFSVFNRFEDSLSVFQTQPIHESAKIFRRTGLDKIIINWGAKPYLPVLLEGQGLFDELARLEADLQGGNAESYFELADRLFFETWQFEQAAALYEKGFAIEQRPEMLWRYLSVLMASGRIVEFMKVHAQLAKLFPEDKRLQVNDEFYKKILSFSENDWLLKL